MKQITDPVLHKIVTLLREKYKCHTVILYGSRAKGRVTATSDYDVVGVCRKGKRTRITKKMISSL